MLSKHSTWSATSCVAERATDQLRILYRRRRALNQAISALERYCALKAPASERPEPGSRSWPFVRTFKIEP